jgi:hypothetical protein
MSQLPVVEEVLVLPHERADGVPDRDVMVRYDCGHVYHWGGRVTDPLPQKGDVRAMRCTQDAPPPVPPPLQVQPEGEAYFAPKKERKRRTRTS